MFAGHYTFIQFWGNKFKELDFHVNSLQLTVI